MKQAYQPQQMMLITFHLTEGNKCKNKIEYGKISHMNSEEAFFYDTYVFWETKTDKEIKAEDYTFTEYLLENNMPIDSIFSKLDRIDLKKYWDEYNEYCRSHNIECFDDLLDVMYQHTDKI